MIKQGLRSSFVLRFRTDLIIKIDLRDPQISNIIESIQERNKYLNRFHNSKRLNFFFGTEFHCKALNLRVEERDCWPTNNAVFNDDN